MKIKRIISLLILSCMLIGAFALVSCSEGDGAPDGYQLIVNNGDKFRLYVPTQAWSPNTYGGTTGAIYESPSGPVTIAVYVADDAGDMTMSEYWAHTEESLKSELDEYAFAGKQEKSPKLGGKDTETYFYTASVKIYGSGEAVSVKYKFMTILCRNGGEMYVMAFAAPEEKYFGDFLKDLEGEGNDGGIIGNFTFAEAYEGKNAGEAPDVKAPEGMKVVSYDEHYYYFFVPENWKINSNTTVSSAYFSDSDRSNVTMQMCMVSESEIDKTVDQYFRECEEKYKEIFTLYTPILVEYGDEKSEEGSDETTETTETVGENKMESHVKMGGRNAKRFVYEFEYGGVKYRQMQVICAKGGVFYVLTYTSSQDETFDSHLPDVEKMIEAFKIR